MSAKEELLQMKMIKGISLMMALQRPHKIVGVCRVRHCDDCDWE